jgi:hypothetical protein
MPQAIDPRPIAESERVTEILEEGEILAGMLERSPRRPQQSVGGVADINPPTGLPAALGAKEAHGK